MKFSDRIGKGLHLNTNQSENDQYPLHSCLQITSLTLDYIFPGLSGILMVECIPFYTLLYVFHVFFLLNQRKTAFYYSI